MMASSIPTNRTTPIYRELFATVGATAPFLPLLLQLLSPTFLSLASELQYTHITLQCGSSLPEIQDLLAELSPKLKQLGLEVNAFDFSSELTKLMRVCKGTKAPSGGRIGMVVGRPAGEVRREGVVVTHAGMSSTFSPHCHVSTCDQLLTTLQAQAQSSTPSASPSPSSSSRTPHS